MGFELTREIVGEIIFGMENQVRDMVFDTETCKVLTVEETGEDYREDEFRFLPLPAWRPVEGFQLMERFTGTLHNPLVREELRKALALGKGVFRKFKVVIKENPGIARLWYEFKDREMKQLVLNWYKDMAETWGFTQKAGKLSDYLEPTEDLVREDFTFEDISESRDFILAWVRGTWTGEKEDMVPGGKDRSSRLNQVLEKPGLKAFRVTAPDGSVAGIIWGTAGKKYAKKHQVGNGKPLVAIRYLFIIKEYRGLGLARELLQRFCADTLPGQRHTVRISLPEKALFLATALSEMGFAVKRQIMELRMPT